MKIINRKEFVRQALGWSSFAVFNSFMYRHPHILNTGTSVVVDTMFIRTVKANNKEVESLITSLSQDITVLKRELGYDFANLAAAYCTPEAKYYQNGTLIPLMERIMQFLIKEQNPDGTLDISNIESPPDTAFILEPICGATSFLLKNTSKKLDTVRALAKQFILKAGDALTEGGVHTPNHRWVISAALAQINALYPNPKYIKRIDEWFSENLFIDDEGHYLERSFLYSEVTDRALIMIARLLNRPELLTIVRKNLDMTYYYIEPNGDVVTTDSRRQDQFRFLNAVLFYMSYRYMAIVDNNGIYASITHVLEKIPDFETKILNQSLFWYLEEPLLKKQLPPLSILPTQYEHFFKKTNLVRFRRNAQTATIFGGADLPLTIGSGRSTSPNFFSFRKGEAILRYMRLSCDFFSTGYFRSDGIKKENGKYVLYQKREVPYYQPLPDDKKQKDGDYKHSESVDRRFWNKMDFENRPLSNVKVLDIKVTIEEKKEGFELFFDIDGTDKIDVTIEFCFKEGGIISPMRTYAEQPDNLFLESGMGTYKAGNDTITFGQGSYKHNRIKGLEGEIYTSHFGTLRTDGMHVFITGKTPFKHTITVS
jgi:hypothetical protein